MARPMPCWAPVISAIFPGSLMVASFREALSMRGRGGTVPSPLTDSIASTDATVVVDARDRLVLPGAVDSHFHIGIYPARAFGLYPRKGAIVVGSDADLAVVDPNREKVVTPEVRCSAQDFTPLGG